MGRELESSISDLCGSLSEVLHHAESSSRALADAVSQRPIHLGTHCPLPLPVPDPLGSSASADVVCLVESATTTFLRKLDGMAEEASADLQHLESMTFGAISFEELLGHFGEALKVYDRQADAIQTRLASSGYVPPGKQPLAIRLPSRACLFCFVRLTLLRAVAEPQVDAEEDEGEAPGISCFGGSTSVLRSTMGPLEDNDALYPSISVEMLAKGT